MERKADGKLIATGILEYSLDSSILQIGRMRKKG